VGLWVRTRAVFLGEGHEGAGGHGGNLVFKVSWEKPMCSEQGVSGRESRACILRTWSTELRAGA
jgi:hypothetical protein